MKANLGNFVLRKRLLDENGRQYHHQGDTSTLHGIPTMLEHNWDRDINNFATITQVPVAVNTSQCS